MMDDDTESTHFFLARCEVGVVRVRSLLELPKLFEHSTKENCPRLIMARYANIPTAAFM